MNGTSSVSERGLLSEADLCRLLGVGERKLKQMRASGIVGAPLELGPRVARWTYQDYLEIVATLPRRKTISEPASLATGRRAKIEHLKHGHAGA